MTKKIDKNIKNKCKYIIPIVVVALMVYFGCSISNIIASEVLMKTKSKEVDNINYLGQIPECIKISEDPVIQNLLQKANTNHKVGMILCDIDEYPEDLLELVSKKDEVIDYVLNYPYHQVLQSKDISIKEDYEPNKIPLFIQWDERWGYKKYGPDFMAVNGCGPTCLAMVAVGLTGNTDINPQTVAEFSEENGYLAYGIGTMWDLMTEGCESFGIKGEELPLSEKTIINTLKKGQPIIVSMAPGTFTELGHYIVLTGVDEENKIIVNDSDSITRSIKTWDIDIFMNEAKNLWTFTPM